MHLFTAGPAQTPKFILDALALPTIHHRREDFKALFQSCCAKLQSLIKLPYLFCLCSSGSGAMESAISSIAPSKILILNHGKFSDRWVKIAQAFQIPYINYQIPSNEVHCVQKVLEYLKEGVDCVCLQSCESSSGVRQKFEEISQAIKGVNSEVFVILDAIASFCIEPLETRWIDVCITSSQKALMLPTGLGFVFLSDFAYARIERVKSLSFYLGLQQYLKDPIAFSLPSSLFFALSQSLDFYIPRIETQYQEIKTRFEVIRSILEEKGAFLYSSYPSLGIIAFEDRGGTIKKGLEKKGILISSGQGDLKGKISRIGNFGLLQEIDLLLKNLKEV